MVQKASGRKIYRTANGKQVDLDLLISRNELTPAVGNARVNARGDELGPGGQIVRKREDVMRKGLTLHGEQTMQRNVDDAAFHPQPSTDGHAICYGVWNKALTLH